MRDTDCLERDLFVLAERTRTFANEIAWLAKTLRDARNGFTVRPTEALLRAQTLETVNKAWGPLFGPPPVPEED